MAKPNPKVLARQRRKARFWKKNLGTAERPRLCVYRSNKHIFAQIIDDQRAVTLAACSTLSKDLSSNRLHTSTVAAAKQVGELLGKKALGMNIHRVVFDRNGFLFHGRIKALADAARDAGLEF